MDQWEKWKDLIAGSFEEFASTLGTYMPRILGALVLLGVGVVLARLLRWFILRAGAGIDSVVQRTGVGSGYLRLRWPMSRIIGGALYWLVLLFFFTAAAQVLGLPGFADLLKRFIAYLPSVLVATAIVFGGFALGALARDRIVESASGAKVTQAEKLGSAVRLVILVLAVVIALGQLGINVQLLEYAVAIVIAASTLAVALAFGLGAGPTVTNIIASRHVRRHFRVGQRIRIGETEGEILEFESTAVVLDTPAGRTLMPARIFQEDASVLVDDQPEGNA